MSFETARRIIQLYSQSNTQRINESLEMAYKEALTLYQNEEAARQAAISILKEEEKTFRDMVKGYNQIRKEQMRGNRSIAKQLAMAQRRQRKENHRVEQRNRQNRWADARDRARMGMQARSARALEKVAEAAVNQYSQKDKAEALQYAEKMVQGTSLWNDKLQKASADLVEQWNKNPTSEMFIQKIQNSGLAEGLNQAVIESSKQQAAYPLSVMEDGAGNQRDTKEKIKKLRVKDLGNSFIESIKAQNDDPRLVKLLKEYMYDDMGSSDLQKKSGKLSAYKDIDDSEIDEMFRKEYLAYLDEDTPRKKIIARTSIGLPARPKVEAFQEELPEMRDTTADKDLARAAQPVFKQLSAKDDTPFELTQEEVDAISPQARDAYEELKRVAVENPLAVTLEERTLLDDLALQRQLQILRRKEQIGRMNPQMKSPETIRYRAAELAEPQQKSVAASLPASTQKYLATERQAFDLSDRDDNHVSNMGAPEATGVSLYKELFDPSIRGFRDGKTYDSVIQRIGENFKSPEEQLRALTAFNSRAMAFQRTLNPIILPDGERNSQYVDAINNAYSKKK